MADELSTVETDASVAILLENHRVFLRYLERRVGDGALAEDIAGVRVFRARAALKKLVVESCGVCAEHGCMNCSCSGSR